MQGKSERRLKMGDWLNLKRTGEEEKLLTFSLEL